MTLTKRILCLILSVCMLGILCTSVTAKDEAPYLSFLAMSDVHLDDLLFQTSNSNISQFQTVLDAAGTMNLDLFVGGGDYSTYGNSIYWYKARNMVRNAGFTNSIWATGNHEYGTLGLRTLTWAKFLAFSGEKSLYYTKTVNGCTFIVLGVESGILGTYGRMSAAQKKWLEKELKTAAENSDGKPIFVISHYDLNTGSVRKDLINELSKYDNIFLLWGHMHGSMYVDMSLKQCVHTESGITVAKMGCVHYYNAETADGLIVRVYDDRVELEMMRISGKILKPDTVTVKLK